MSDEKPTLDAWRRLYAVTAEIKRLEPWLKMTEEDIFGVQDPETGELSFVSVMGMLGEHHAVSVYLGAEAVYDVLDFADSDIEPGDLAGVERILSIRQLQAAFEDREALEKEDREIIKQLGLKFRGRGNWPTFRSFKAGFFPWFLTASEVQQLTLALEQLIDMFPRFVADDSLLICEEDDQFLVRVPRRAGDSMTWSDEIRHIPPPDIKPIPVKVDMPLLEATQKLPRRNLVVEMDFFMMLTPITDREPPYYPYMLLLIDAQSGMILGFDMLYIETTLEDMWASVPLAAIKRFGDQGMLPTEIQVSSEQLLEVLKPIAKTLKVKVTLTDYLPALEDAKYALNEFGHGMPLLDDDFDYGLPDDGFDFLQ